MPIRGIAVPHFSFAFLGLSHGRSICSFFTLREWKTRDRAEEGRGVEEPPKYEGDGEMKSSALGRRGGFWSMADVTDQGDTGLKVGAALLILRRGYEDLLKS